MSNFVRKALRRVVACGVVLLAASAASVHGASSTTVVTMDVWSATSLNVGGCPSDTADVTSLGVLLPDSTATTTLDCTLVWGSSNDTASLRMSQLDRTGEAMFRTTDGTLEPTFDGDLGGGDGVVTRDVNGTDNLNDAVLLADGSIVAAGYTDSLADATLFKFDRNGVLDVTFDGGVAGNGIVDYDAFAGNDWLYRLTEQQDGKFVAVGRVNNGSSQILLMRMLPDGTLDPDFDGTTSGNGIIQTDPAGYFDTGSSVTLQDDGRIVVAGQVSIVGNLVRDRMAAVIRYLPDGTLDPTFGPGGPDGNGIVSWEGTSSEDVASDVVVLDDGSMVVVGRLEEAEGKSFIAKLTSTGAFDPTFDGDTGGNGLVVLDLVPGHEELNDIVVTEDGGFVVGGQAGSSGGSADSLLVRFHADGRVDTGFDGPSGSADGVVVTALAAVDDEVEDLVVDADGSLAVISSTDDNAIGYTIVRRLDPSTGASIGWFNPQTGGLASRSVSATNDNVNAVVVAEDGSLIAVGLSNNGTDNDVLLVRYAGVPIDDFASGSTDWVQPSVGAFGACLETATAGATGVWPVAGNDACLTSTAAVWRAVPATSDLAAAEVAQTAAPGDGATVTMRFGARSLPAQAPGDYVAPLEITVLAPDV